MNSLIMIGPFGLPDAAALAVFLAAWLLIGWFIEHPPQSRPSVSLLMQDYRRESEG